MNTVHKHTNPDHTEANPEVLDRVHLARYTLDSLELEREIIGLFLTQLPETMAMIQAATRPEEWKLATHSLKGSAAAVGARRINLVAAALEATSLDQRSRREELAAELQAASDEFRALAARLYG